MRYETHRMGSGAGRWTGRLQWGRSSRRQADANEQAAPTPGTATSTVGVHGSANTSTLSGVIPIGDSTIQARDLQGRMVGTATTNAKGIFSLQLPPGEYDFSVLGSAGGAVGRGPACTTRATVRRMPGGIQVDIRCTARVSGRLSPQEWFTDTRVHERPSRPGWRDRPSLSRARLTEVASARVFSRTSREPPVRWIRGYRAHHRRPEQDGRSSHHP